MADFELQGNDGDETRILHDRISGYSVALAGRPSLAPMPEGDIKYDVVIKLGDIEVEHGFRIDDVPSPMSPQALAAAFATAYAKNRAQSTPQVNEIPEAYLPTGAVGGARAQYRVRGSDTNVERVWVATKPSPTGVWALYHTTRADLEQVNPVRWSHVLSTMNGQQRWSDVAAPRAPIWPVSEIATASAKLDLTNAERDEAVAKARALGGHGLGNDIITWLAHLAQTDDPPALVLEPGRVDAVRSQLAVRAPRDAEVLGRTLDRCRTALDLRAWAWQCVWAIGNAPR
ncbi:MAG: hypothetical protein AB7T06_37935 [Kofleriaceae bacterium]